jgi:hypothetical protein
MLNLAQVIRLRGYADYTPSATSISALRLMTNMDIDEFSAALSKEVGWSLPLFVYLQWERSDAIPPPVVLEAARKVAAHNPIDNRTSGMSRRKFLGRVMGVSTVAAAGLPLSPQPLSASLNPSQYVHRWQVSSETSTDLKTLVESYRRAYAGSASVGELLPRAICLMQLLIDLGRREQWPVSRAQLTSLVGQMAVLVGLLHLMGPRDLHAAHANYSIALSAARDAQDWDLASYALGSFAFLADSARRPADARSMGDAAWDLAFRRATPRTRAWAGALNSELRARDGDETASRKFLEHAFDAIAEARNEPAWKGAGWFDEPRLAGYEGGNLALLGRHEAAEQTLRSALGRLDPLRIKHFSTLSADLATVLVHRREIEESCEYAMRALTLATSIAHQESIDRVRGVHFRLLHWKSHTSVRELTQRLQAVQ